MRKKQQKTATSHEKHEAWQPQSFAQATDISTETRLRQSLERRILIMRVCIIVLVAAAVLVAATPFVLQWKSARQYASQSESIHQEVAGWPYPKAEEALQAARAYNQRLAAQGQIILGEAADPFASVSGSSSTANTDDSAAEQDEEYQSLLDTGDGVMGSVVIPKIGVDLPIYHGTSQQALASGAGHLYGSSLPVGGANTHAVITGHRGLVNAAMFTRLDEMREGDFFYIEVMGETLGYSVDKISVITPDDDSQLRIVPSEDRITLMTCTPYGVNTHRLLVSGHRVSIPHPAPDPSDLYDARTIGILACIATLILGFIGCVVWSKRRERAERMKHARAQ